MNISLRNYRALSLIVLILVAIAIAGVSWHRAVSGSSDFDVYYYAAKSVRFGEPLYTINHHSTSESGSPFVYPPFFAFLMAPFTLVPIGIAAALWNLFNLGLFVGCILLVIQLLPAQIFQIDLKYFNKITWLVVPALLMFVWFFDNVAMAQVNIFVLFFVLLSFRLLTKREPVAAGFALGLSVVVKLIPLLFFPYFLIRREWKYTLGFLFALLPALVVPTLAVGVQKCFEYHNAWINETLKDHTQPETLGFYASQLSPSHQNLQAVLFRLLIDWDFRESTGGPNGKRFKFRTPIRLTEKQSANASRLSVLITAFLLFVLLFMTIKYHDWLDALSAIFCGMVLFAPKVRSHFFIFLLVPIFVLAEKILRKEQSGRRATIEKATLIASVTLYFLQVVKYFKFLGFGCWSVLIMFVFFMTQLFQRENRVNV